MDDSKKRRGKNVNMADVNQPSSKKKRGIFNSKAKKKERGETVSSRKDTVDSTQNKQDEIDLKLQPDDDHFDNNYSDPRFRDSNQTYGSSFEFRSLSNPKLGLDTQNLDQFDGDSQTFGNKNTEKLHLDNTFDDDDLLARPKFDQRDA